MSATTTSIGISEIPNSIELRSEKPIQGNRYYIALIGYFWATLGVASATAVFYLVRHWLDYNEASMLYLPVVIACAVRFGFGPAVLGAVLSFLSWDYFFLPPANSLVITTPRDWLSLVGFLIAAITTAHLASNARSQAHEAATRERETAMLYTASQTISQQIDVDTLLLTLVEQLILSCHATRSAVLLPTSDEEDLTIAAASSQHELATSSSKAIQDAALALYRGTKPRTDDNEFASTVTEGEGCGLYVPLKVSGTVCGVLYVGLRGDGLAFSSQDERLILTLANHAAVVIARQRLADEAKQQTRQTATLEERNRIARDVHDTLSHAFTGIKFLLEAATRIGPTQEALTCIEEAQKLAVNGAQEARRSVWALRPAALDEAGDLASAIQHLASLKTLDSPLKIDFETVGEPYPLPEAIEENMLRICQEALTNAIRHAAATCVSITLSFEESRVSLAIQDDGKGFDPSNIRSGGSGLSNMRERSRQIGGTVSIKSEILSGTVILVQVPLSE